MNTRIQPQIEIDLTDEQLANVSGGFGGWNNGWGRGDGYHDEDDRRGNHWGNDRRWGHRDCDDDDRRWHPSWHQRWHPHCNWR